MVKEAIPFLAPGEQVDIYVNQGYREATVLAAIDNKRLVEYSMPNGTTALSFLDITNVSKRTAVSYWALPIKWLVAITNQGTGYWIGNPQQNNRAPVPSPQEMLERKQKRKE